MNNVCMILIFASCGISLYKRAWPFAVCLVFFAFLTVGQSYYIEREIAATYMTILDSYITVEGFESAKIYTLISVLVIFFISIFAPAVKPARISVRPATIYQPSLRFYIGLLVFMVITYGVLIFAVVGLSEFLTASRPGTQSGATIFIVLFFVGVMPSIVRLGTDQSLSSFDIVLLILALLMTGGFSRIHAILEISCVFYAYCYGRGIAFRKFRLFRSILAVVGALFAAMLFFGFGAFRDALNYTNNDISGVFQYLSQNPEDTLLSLDYNYRVSVEGMSGLAGAMTYAHDYPNMVSYDFGLSWLVRGITQWMPGLLKEQMQGFYDFADSFNWYTDAIVPPGISVSFMSFGWMGPLIYGLFLYFSTWWLLYKVGSSMSVKTRVIIYMILGTSIFLVRGSWVVWVGFGISYLAVINIVWPLFKMQFRRRDESCN